MFRFLLGVIAVVCLIIYGDEIKTYLIDIGLRDLAVTYLKTW